MICTSLGPADYAKALVKPNGNLLKGHAQYAVEAQMITLSAGFASGWKVDRAFIDATRAPIG